MSVVGPNTLPTTRLGTSDPVDLCDGLSLFPPTVPSALGITYNGTFFSKKVKALGTEFKAEAGYFLNAGACGPSWATVMTVDGIYGSSDQPFQDELNFIITNEETQAGFVMGFDVGLTFELKVKLWSDEHEFNISPTFDLIEIALYLLQQALGPEHFLTKLGNVLPSVEGSWGAYDSGGRFTQNNGVVSASPVFTIPINLWSLLVDVDDSTAVFDGTLVVANKILGKTKSSIIVGPAIGLGITTTITMQSILINEQPFSITEWEADTNTVIATGGAFNLDAQTMTFNFQQVPSFDLTLGFTFQLSLAQVINLGETFTFSLLQDLGITIDLGTFQQSISANVPNPMSAVSYDIELA